MHTCAQESDYKQERTKHFSFVPCHFMPTTHTLQRLTNKYNNRRLATPTINKIHWDQIDPALSVFGIDSGFAVFAIWPEPVDHDACLREAGFSAFADIGVDDPGFHSMAERLWNALAAFGAPRRKSGDAAGRSFDLWESLLTTLGLRPRAREASLLDCLVIPAENDQFPPRVIDFGNPSQATVVTSDGHPIFWLGLSPASKGNRDEIVRAMGDGRPCEQTKLDWKKLAPVGR